MRLFTLDEEYDIIPEKDTIMLVPEFKALWTLKYNGHKKHPTSSRERPRGKQEITYLYFYCDYRSEFSELTDAERHEAALAAANLDEDYKLSKELEAAKAKYLQMQETRELKLLTSAYGVIDKLRVYFDNVEVSSSNSKTIIENLAKLGPTLQGLKRLEEQVRKQQRQDGKIRGGQDRGFLD